MLLVATLQLLLATQAANAVDPAPVVERSAPTFEQDQLATLRRIESELSVGRPLDDGDRNTLVEFVGSASPLVRATAVAVLPWLEPAVAVPLLLKARHDDDSRVRATVGQSLMPLGRRVTDAAERANVVAAAIALIDDRDDEVSCVGAELLAALSSTEAQAALQQRASQASDQRYQCFARFAGLPARVADVRPLPPLPGDTGTRLEPGATPGPGNAATPVVVDTDWLSVIVATGAGLMVGGTLPSGFVPARDFLVYDDTSTRLSRQELSFGTTVASGLAGGLAFGGAAFALDRVAGPLSTTEAAAGAAGTASAALAGAGLAYALLPTGGAGAVLLASTTAAGLVASMGWVRVVDVTANDNTLMLGAMGLGSLVGALGVVAALPVALSDVGVDRGTIGVGAAVAAAGVAGVGALAVAPLVDVTPMRVVAVASGAGVGAGLVGGIAFAAVPADLDVATRIGAGFALGGAAVGAVVGVLVPGSWLGDGGTTTTTTNAAAANTATTTTTLAANEVE